MSKLYLYCILLMVSTATTYPVNGYTQSVNELKKEITQKILDRI